MDMHTPTEVSDPTRTTLVGREAELGELFGLLDTVFEGGSVRLVHGDPGVGKSALLAAVGARARDLGMLVLRTTGAEFEAQMPFSGLQQLLEGVVDTPEAARLIPAQRDALEAALGSASDAPEVFLVALATLSLLTECASLQPVLLIVDDAQWLDQQTVDVIRFVARRLEADPVVGVIAYRDGCGSTLEDANLRELVVGGLEPAAAAALLDAHSPGLDVPIRSRVLKEAEGNPLALLELPQAWRDRNIGWSSTEDVPITKRLERAFGARVADLPPAARTLLLIAALNDRDTLAEIIEATSQLEDEVPALDCLGLAEGARLVTSDGQALRFTHPLIRAAVRQQAKPAERRRAHFALARVLESEPDRSVWHLAANSFGPDEAIASRLELIASRARQRQGTGVALVALRRSAELSSDDASRGRRLLAAAELAFQLGRSDDMTEMLDQAEALELAQKDRHCILWLREALAEARGAGTVDAMIAVANKLISDGDARLALNALLTAALKCHQFNVEMRSRASVVQAVDRLALADDDAMRLAIYALADPSRQGPQVVRALAHTSPADLMGPDTTPAHASERLHMCALALTMVPEFQRASQFQAAAIDGLRSQGRLGLLSRGLASQAVTYLALGDWQLATQAAEECLRLAPDAEAPPPRLAIDRNPRAGRRQLDSGTAHLVLSAVAGGRGDFDAAAELIADAERILTPLAANFSSSMIQAARTAVALSRGDYTEAFEHAARIYDPTDPAYHWQVGRWRSVVIDTADAGWLSGNAQRARTLLASLESPPTGEELRATLAYAAVVLGGEGSSDDLQLTHSGTERPPAAVIQGRMDLARGIRLRRQRRSKAARSNLRAAFETFSAIGAAPWAGRAGQELRATGETLRRFIPDRRDELSPQEFQIASMAAAGLTNREIGARLFLSHRTVGAHLYRVFPKLGVSSRSELRAALDDEDGSGAV